MWHISPFTPKNLEVAEREPMRTFSGIYDANGNKIFHIEYNTPIGFVHFAEKDDEQKETL